MKPPVHITRILVAVAVLGELLVLQPSLRAADEDSAETIKALRKRLEELDQKIRVLERKNELTDEAAAEKAKSTTPGPSVSLGANGFAFSSADTNFVLKVKGLLQVDTRTFINDNPLSEGNDGFILRRARPIIEGTVFRDFDFQFVPDFAGSSAQILDAWLNYRYRPEVQLKVGKYKSPVGLEQLLSDASLPFNERSLVTDLMPNRDLGVQFWGDASVVSYAFGIFNGVGDSRNSSNADFDDSKAFEGRVFLHPFQKSDSALLKTLSFGVGGSYSEVSSNATGLPNNNGFTTDGQQLFFAYTNGVAANGTHWRVSPQFYWYYGPVGVLGEYAFSHQRVSRATFEEDLQHTAWQIACQWVLTGEDATPNGVSPRHPFNPAAGHWGAWQLAARYSELDVDNAAFPIFANVGSPGTELEFAL